MFVQIIVQYTTQRRSENSTQKHAFAFRCLKCTGALEASASAVIVVVVPRSPACPSNKKTTKNIAMFRLHAGGIALAATRRYLLCTPNSGAITVTGTSGGGGGGAGNTGGGQSHCHRALPTLLQQHAALNDAYAQARRGTWTQRRSSSRSAVAADGAAGGACPNCAEPRTLIIGRVGKITQRSATHDDGDDDGPE